MPDYDNRNRGNLFRNDKGGNDARPDYRGSLDVDGVQYWVSAWIKVAGPNSKTPGQKFLSLSIEPKEMRRDSTADRRQPAKAASHGVPDSAFGDESDIGF